MWDISIHALLAESDGDTTYSIGTLSTFLSTLSLRRATRPKDLKSRRMVFLSTLSLRRATLINIGFLFCLLFISIHALLAESDTPSILRHCTTYLFLSTLSLRRATQRGQFVWIPDCYFYPRSPCGERRGVITACPPLPSYFYPRSPCGERHRPHLRGCSLIGISIHALLAESDAVVSYTSCLPLVFLSTLSLRRATTC